TLAPPNGTPPPRGWPCPARPPAGNRSGWSCRPPWSVLRGWCGVKGRLEGRRAAGEQPLHHDPLALRQLAQQVVDAVQRTHGAETVVEEIIQVAKAGRMGRAAQHAEGALQHAASDIAVDVRADFADQGQLPRPVVLAALG